MFRSVRRSERPRILDGTFNHALPVNPGDASTGGAAALAFAMLAITTAFHYEALRLLERAAAGRTVSQGRAVGFLITLVAVHLAEVSLYA
ncbi:MAG TPA: hypothetical protein VGO08_23420, partial [Burkholderiales bacterium]|nr:hypothetical protein [Burkholderiales bacterium]